MSCAPARARGVASQATVPRVTIQSRAAQRTQIFLVSNRMKMHHLCPSNCAAASKAVATLCASLSQQVLDQWSNSMRCNADARPASAVSEQRPQKLRPLDEADDLTHPPISERDPGWSCAVVRVFEDASRFDASRQLSVMCRFQVMKRYKSMSKSSGGPTPSSHTKVVGFVEAVA